MTAVLRPDLQQLPKAQRELWPELRSVGKSGYVLYGGTAVSLRLGHRISVDFDFFSNQPLVKDRLFRDTSFLAAAQVLQDEPDSLSALVQRLSGTVKVSFFGRIEFGRVGDPQWTEDGIVQVASSDDLLATKLKVLLQRVEAKDYVDIAALLDSGLSLARGLAGATTLYGSSFQPAESLKALTYFEGGDLNQLSDRVKRRLVQAVNEVGALPSVRRVASELALSNPK